MNVLSKLLVGSLVIGATHSIVGMDKSKKKVDSQAMFRSLTELVDAHVPCSKTVNKESERFFQSISPASPNFDERKSPASPTQKWDPAWDKIINKKLPRRLSNQAQ